METASHKLEYPPRQQTIQSLSCLSFLHTEWLIILLYCCIPRVYITPAEAKGHARPAHLQHPASVFCITMVHGMAFPARIQYYIYKSSLARQSTLIVCHKRRRRVRHRHSSRSRVHPVV